MAECFLGEIRMFGFGFAPSGWALCNGQLLPIAQNVALYSLLGTAYGGNGSNNFALPNLQSRVPVGAGSSRDPSWNPPPMPLGEQVGEEQVTLVTAQLPVHTHAVNVAANATTGVPGGDVVLASSAASKPYRSEPAELVPLDGASVIPAGAGLPHPNLQPCLAVNFAIALVGIYPSRD